MLMTDSNSKRTCDHANSDGKNDENRENIRFHFERFQSNACGWLTKFNVIIQINIHFRRIKVMNK